MLCHNTQSYTHDNIVLLKTWMNYYSYNHNGLDDCEWKTANQSSRDKRFESKISMQNK